jgi:hypothetical protein
MYPYGNDQIPQIQFEYNPYVQQDQYDPNRQLSQLLQLICHQSRVLHLREWKKVCHRKLKFLENSPTGEPGRAMYKL